MLSRCYRIYALLTWLVILNQAFRDSVLIYDLRRKEKILFALRSSYDILTKLHALHREIRRLDVGEVIF